jgi:hypothetical protein
MSDYWACFRCGADCDEPNVYCSEACRKAEEDDSEKLR